MSPALSKYYAQTLALSHTDMAVARFVFMALGVAVASYWWRKSVSKISILQLTLWILVGFGVFPLVLLLAQYHLSFLYLGFWSTVSRKREAICSGTSRERCSARNKTAVPTRVSASSWWA